LSIKTNDDGTYEIGVHIADVAYFVKPNTALDRDARKRATSVYLVQRAVPMLPPTLSEELCSLNPGQERLAFSAFYTVTKDAQIINKTFAKTIIKCVIVSSLGRGKIPITDAFHRSAAKLSYDVAQDVLDGKILGDVPVAPEHDAADIAHDIKVLNDIARQLRTKRFATGTLALDSTRLTFKLDEKGLPIDCSSYERYDAHKLVEEVSFFRVSSLKNIVNRLQSLCFSPISLPLNSLL
jgi:protein SSD1